MCQGHLDSNDLYYALRDAHSRVLPLIEKYSGAAPRYTSYPTAVEFSSSVKSAEWIELLKHDPVLSVSKGEECERSQSLSLYVHIPFCSSLCYFCACNKVITKDSSLGDKYLDALERELQSYSSLFDTTVPLEQLHLGGGTPNFLNPQQIKRLGMMLHSVFPNRLSDAEISVETDPRTLLPEHIEAFFAEGFNRISLGVQDFTPEVQQAINRIQPFEQTKALCSLARSTGISRINIDLIYGLPEQTIDGFRRSVEQVLEIRPSRVALYGYAHVTWLKKVQRALERSGLPSPAERVALFLEGVRLFMEAGYRYIGLDHFALPEDELSIAQDSGRLNRNFMGYSTHSGTRMLALGVSSISIIPRAIVQNYKSIGDYEKAVAESGLAVERGVLRNEEDMLRADVIEELLCYSSLDIPGIQSRWGINFKEHFASSLHKLCSMKEDGLIELSDERIAVTPLGRLFARNIAACFDAYLEKHQRGAAPVFSQAV